MKKLIGNEQLVLLDKIQKVKPKKIFFNKIHLIVDDIRLTPNEKKFFIKLSYSLSDLSESGVKIINHFRYYFEKIDNIVYFLLKKEKYNQENMYDSFYSLALLYKEIAKLEYIQKTYSENSLYLVCGFINKKIIEKKEFLLIDNPEYKRISKNKKILFDFFVNEDFAIDLFSLYLNCPNKNKTMTFRLKKELKISIPDDFYRYEKLFNDSIPFLKKIINVNFIFADYQNNGLKSDNKSLENNENNHKKINNKEKNDNEKEDLKYIEEIKEFLKRN